MLCYHLILFFPLVIKSELIWLTNFENSLANCEGKNTMYYKNRKWVPFSITFFSVQKWSFQGHKIVFLQSFYQSSTVHILYGELINSNSVYDFLATTYLLTYS